LQLIPAEVTKTDSGNKPDKPQQIFKTDELNLTEECIQDNDEILYMFYVNEEKLNSCPTISICVGNQLIPTEIDTGVDIMPIGAEVTSESRYVIKHCGGVNDL